MIQFSFRNGGFGLQARLEADLNRRHTFVCRGFKSTDNDAWEPKTPFMKGNQAKNMFWTSFKCCDRQTTITRSSF